MPGSAPYVMAAARMKDVQAIQSDHRPLRTFTSARPMLRLDHIFVSTHFETRGVFVPRNDLTRVASDHLPLIADLQVVSAAGGTSTTTRPGASQSTRPAQSGALV